jgi:hypothetical protein
MNEPLTKGIFVFNEIEEGEDKIVFNPPLNVSYQIFEKIDKESGKENYNQDSSIMGFARYDFGMDIEVSLSEDNMLTSGYHGLTKESPPEEILMKSIMFDLFHAFLHPSEDPNYTHYHFALLGWLKDRAKITNA